MAGDRISIRANGKETVLADFNDSVQEGSDITPDSEFQVVRYFRGSTVAIFDRENQSVTLSFFVNRDYPDDIKAWDAWLTCRTNTPRTGNLYWKARGSRSTFTRYIIGCGIRVKPIVRIGNFVRFQYTIIGGEVSKTAPTEESA